MRFWVLLLVAAAFAGGWFASGQLLAVTGAASQQADSGKREPLYWVAPMDANYRRDKPGKSPMGMDLVPVYEDGAEGPDDGGVTIAPNVVANLGVRQAEVTRGPLSKPVATVGYVTYDEDRLVHIHSRVAGWVEVLNIKAQGEQVEKGQTLFEIFSPELVLAQEEFLQAKRSGQSGLEKGARRKLASLGISPDQIEELARRGTSRETLAIKAPAAGHVADLGIRQGMYIRPDTRVMAIGTLESVWVMGEFFERQTDLVREGNPVIMTAAAFPGQQWQGTVDYVYPELSEKSRTLQARVRIANGPEDRSLRPNMFVNLTMQAPLGESLVSIPKEALIRGGRADRVIIAEGQGRFRPVPVTAGVEAGDRVVVLEGLEPGQQVVTSGQFLIDSETNLDAAISRLSAPPEMAAANTVEVASTIAELIPDTASLTLEHDPIPEWQWPAMTMEFKAAEGLALDRLEVGQRVKVAIEDNGGSYKVVAIEEADSSASSKTAVPVAQEKEDTIESTGTVQALDPIDRSITLAHEPIPALSWPAMEMAFDVSDSVDLDAVEVGAEVRFSLLENAEGDLEIISVQPVNKNP